MWQRSCPMWLILSINIPFIHGRFSFTCTTAVWFQEREFQVWPTVTKAISVISDSEKAEQLQSRSLKYFTFLFWVWISLFVNGDFTQAECPVHRVAHRATGFECNLLHLCVCVCVCLCTGERKQQHQSLRLNICNICGTCHWSHSHLPVRVTSLRSSNPSVWHRPGFCFLLNVVLLWACLLFTHPLIIVNNRTSLIALELRN